jgi:hypothetical protein
MVESHWRVISRRVIRPIISRWSKDCPERRQALRDAYPFGERAHWPYQIWLDEIKIQTGQKQNKRSAPSEDNPQMRLL